MIIYDVNKFDFYFLTNLLKKESLESYNILSFECLLLFEIYKKEILNDIRQKRKVKWIVYF
jgi:hypothetical protein